MRVGQAVGVLADDQVPFLQAQHALRFDAEGPQAPRQPGRVQRLPHFGPAAGGHVNFVAQLADEADAHQTRRRAGDPTRAHGQIGKRLILQIDVRQRLQNLAARRAGEIECGAMAGDIHQRAVESPQRIEPQQFAKHAWPSRRWWS